MKTAGVVKNSGHCIYSIGLKCFLNCLSLFHLVFYIYISIYDLQCNCRQPTKCPLDGNCLSSCIIYKATVSLEKEQVAYIGLTSTTFKERYNNHNKSFNHEKYENKTELSKYVWKLKKKNKKLSITWKIISHATTKRRPSNQCNLCLEEKYQILKHSGKKPCLLLNKRFEIRACNHK